MIVSTVRLQKASVGYNTVSRVVVPKLITDKLNINDKDLFTVKLVGNSIIYEKVKLE